MTYNPASTAAPPSDLLLVGNRVEMMASQPLPDLDSAGGRAYAARHRGVEGTADLFAVVCDKNLPARLDMITAMGSIDHPGVLRLIDSGLVQGPGDQARRYVFAYQRPLTGRMKQSIDEPHAPMSEDFLSHHFIAPMIAALVELQHVGIVHNAIRPTNIFWRTGGTTVPQLGECLSAPAGYGQPVLFEPLNRAMSNPMGRGVGLHVDDCYAFGVTLALLILGSNPMQGMDDDAIINAKIERGSFGALIGTRRISPTHIEILRGLLADDARQRWSGSDMEQWTNGRRLTPKNTDAGKRAARAFEFLGREYWLTRPLALAMAAHVGEGAAIIEDGSLDKWLRRAMNDDTRAANLADAQVSLKKSGKSANYEDQLVARACIALDPAAPIRYRGLAVMPMGIASMLVDALTTGNNAQILSEIISSQLVSFWVEMQQEAKIELVPLGQQLERMKALIEKTSLGNGIERVAYELNPGLHCLSPILRSQYVTSAKNMLTALERVAGSGERPPEPMDRHIAAFLIVRERRNESTFEALAAPAGSPRRGLALLSLYSDLQERHGPDTLPHLAQWLLPLLEPALQGYLGKTVKERLREQVRDAAARGSLGLLARLLNDPRRIERDRQEFMAARMLYLSIMKEIAVLENRIANRETVVRESGKPMAASISTFIAILLIFAAVLHAVWRAMF
jgi:hypothetical protein